MRESRSLFLVAFRSSSDWQRRPSFSSGKRMVRVLESISMPKKVIQDVGPALLDASRGTPRSSQVC